jgi:SAM-dependent methyltransferase
MYYDPVKEIFASAIKKFPFLRTFFYKILDLVFLRSWYVRRELKKLRIEMGNRHLDILDAGTGYAQYTYFIARKLKPNSIYAIDVKEEWIKNSKEFFSSKGFSNIRFGVEDLISINYESKFDLIICVDVMEHIENDILVFRNFYRALKKGGYLLINTPSTFGGSDVHENEGESFIGEHAREGYSREDFESKLKPIGFSIYNSKYSYGFWGDKAWRFGIKYPMLLLNISKIFFLVLPVYFLVTFPFVFIMMLIDYHSNNKIGTGITLTAKKD